MKTIKKMEKKGKGEDKKGALQAIYKKYAFNLYKKRRN